MLRTQPEEKGNPFRVRWPSKKKRVLILHPFLAISKSKTKTSSSGWVDGACKYAINNIQMVWGSLFVFYFTAIPIYRLYFLSIM